MAGGKVEAVPANIVENDRTATNTELCAQRSEILLTRLLAPLMQVTAASSAKALRSNCIDTWHVAQDGGKRCGPLLVMPTSSR